VVRVGDHRSSVGSVEGVAGNHTPDTCPSGERPDTRPDLPLSDPERPTAAPTTNRTRERDIWPIGPAAATPGRASSTTIRRRQPPVRQLSSLDEHDRGHGHQSPRRAVPAAGIGMGRSRCGAPVSEPHEHSQHDAGGEPGHGENDERADAVGNALIRLAEAFNDSCDYLLLDDAPRRPFRTASPTSTNSTTMTSNSSSASSTPSSPKPASKPSPQTPADNGL